MLERLIDSLEQALPPGLPVHWVLTSMLVYMPVLAVAAIAGFRLLRRIHLNPPVAQALFAPASQSVVRVSFWMLFLYFLLYLVVESLAWAISVKNWNNHYIYTTGMMICTTFIFIFYYLHVRKGWFALLLAGLSGGTLALYFYHSLWDNTVFAPYYYGVYLFAINALAAGIFLAHNLAGHSRHSNSFNIRLASIFVIYNFLSIFVAVFMLRHDIPGLTIFEVFYFNLALATLFYLLCALVMRKLSKQLRL